MFQYWGVLLVVSVPIYAYVYRYSVPTSLAFTSKVPVPKKLPVLV